jgi:hypothetical protein
VIEQRDQRQDLGGVGHAVALLRRGRDRGAVLEAENGVINYGAADPGPAGASGSTANKVMRCTNVATNATVDKIVMLHRPAERRLDDERRHVPRVRPRAGADNNRGRQRALAMGSAGRRQWSYNDWVPIVDEAGAAIEGTWVIVDLGLVTAACRARATTTGGSPIDADAPINADDVDSTGSPSSPSTRAAASFARPHSPGLHWQPMDRPRAQGRDRSRPTVSRSAAAA